MREISEDKLDTLLALSNTKGEVGCLPFRNITRILGNFGEQISDKEYPFYIFEGECHKECYETTYKVTRNGTDYFFWLYYQTKTPTTITHQKLKYVFTEIDEEETQLDEQQS